MLGKNLIIANEKTAQEIARAVTIQPGCLGDGDPQQETESVYQHVSFPSNHLLAHIIATYSGLASCANALATKDRSGRGFFYRAGAAPEH